MNVYRPIGTVEAHQGEDVTIECVAIGLPQPVITWEKYGGIVPKDRAMIVNGRCRTSCPLYQRLIFPFLSFAKKKASGDFFYL